MKWNVSDSCGFGEEISKDHNVQRGNPVKAQAFLNLHQPPPVADAQVLPLGSSAPPPPPAPRPSGGAVVSLFHAVLSYYAPQP